MKKGILFAGAALTMMSAARAATPVSYTFKGIVEYGSGPGHKPVSAREGAYVTVTIVLDSSVAGTLSGNTMTYTGGIACGGQSSPVLSAMVSGQTANFGNGACDSVSITRDPNGTSSITMGSGTFHIGTTFQASFVTSNPAVIRSYNIPAKIPTVNYDRSMFHFVVPNFEISGDMSGR